MMSLKSSMMGQVLVAKHESADKTVVEARCGYKTNETFTCSVVFLKDKGSGSL